MNRALWMAVLCAACGGGKIDSPETLAQAAFEATAAGDQARFLEKQLQIADLDRHCPGWSPASRAEAEAELAAARDEAVRSFVACRQEVRLDGARFLTADRSPSAIVHFRWPGCDSALSFSWLRVHFDVAGTRGTLLVTEVASIGGRWLFRGGVRLCEGSAP
jgi:hypothetical protein